MKRKHQQPGTQKRCYLLTEKNIRKLVRRGWDEKVLRESAAHKGVYNALTDSIEFPIGFY